MCKYCERFLKNGVKKTRHERACKRKTEKNEKTSIIEPPIQKKTKFEPLDV